MTEKRKVGKPTKLTPEISDRIVKLIKAGNYRETACASVGISPRTLRNWLKSGALGTEPFASFSEAMDEAEAMAEAGLVMHIRSAVDWRASAYILKCRFPQRWTEKMEAAEGKKDAGPAVVINVAGDSEVAAANDSSDADESSKLN